MVNVECHEGCWSGEQTKVDVQAPLKRMGTEQKHGGLCIMFTGIITCENH